MAATAAQVLAKVVADVSGLKQGYQQAKDETDKQKSWFKGAMGDMFGVVGGMLAASGISLGIGQIVGTMKSWVGEAIDARQQHAQLVDVLKSTNDAVGLSADQIEQMAQNLQNLDGVNKDVTLTGQNMLLTFTNIGRDVFPEASQAMLDMAVKMNNGSLAGLDLKDTAIQLGKALDDPIKGLTALSRVGVTFTEDQKKQIKAMVDAGNTAGAQRIILKELEREFGGAAAAAGNSDPFNKFNLTMKDMGRTIGDLLLPPLTTLTNNVLIPVAGWIQDHINPAMDGMNHLLQDLKDKFVQAFNDPNGQKVAKLRDLAKDLKDKLKDMSDWVKDHVKPALDDMATAAGNVAGWLADLKQHVKDVHDWFVQWEPEIITTSSIITFFFLPALIKAGAQAVFSGGQIAFQFVANIIKSGEEAIAASWKVWVWIGSTIAAGVRAAAEGVVIAGTFIAELIDSGYQAVIAAGKFALSYIPGLKAVGAQASTTAGEVEAEAAAEETAGNNAETASGKMGAFANSETNAGAEATTATGSSGSSGGGGFGVLGLVFAITALYSATWAASSAFGHWIGSNLLGWLQDVGNAAQNLWDWISKVVGEISKGSTGVPIPPGYGKPGGGSRAGGGPVWAGGAYLVGEHGPELFLPKQNGAILTAGQTQAVLQAQRQSYTQNITINGVVDSAMVVDRLKLHNMQQKALAGLK